MCGIAGIVTKTDAQSDRTSMKRMLQLIEHRGPDDEGVWSYGNVQLGHRRLAIIDLDRRGRQPMTRGQRYWISFNGEIYNYLELRDELHSLGETFHTGTDTEVILAAYSRWGPECLTRFNGMWAFAIVDVHTHTLFLARDRFGVKPLYYTNGPHRFAFGSEIKQLSALQERVRANKRVVVESLLTRYDGHTPETFFDGILALPPAHHATYDLRAHSLSIARYYTLRRQESWQGLDVAASAIKVREVLESSISLRLRSDVTVGTCLSGGLDSSSISAIASRQNASSRGGVLVGIHARSTEDQTDESSYARAVSRHCDISLDVVTPSVSDFQDTIDEVVYTQEEPFGSPSMFMGWHVFQRAKQLGCKVMLNGQGGDETFLGYERYYAALLRQTGALALPLQVVRQSRHSKLGMSELLQYFLYFNNAAIRIARLRRRSYLREAEIDGYNFEAVRRSVESFSNVELMQKLEISELQLPHLLRYEDRSSMRHGIETRLPFLDYRLVEGAISLPATYKIRDGWTKFVLRCAVEDVLPGSIVWRRNKLGFEAPAAQWIEAYEKHMVVEIRGSSILNEIADTAAILRNFSRMPHSERWAYFCLAAWERVFSVNWD